MRKADSQFLSTSPNWDLKGMLSTLPEGSVPVSLVVVEPRSSKIGLNEEKGLWIQRLWQEVTSKFPEAQGLRTSWNQIVFFWPNRRIGDVVKDMTNLLRNSTAAELKSLAIFRLSSTPRRMPFTNLSAWSCSSGRSATGRRISSLRITKTAWRLSWMQSNSAATRCL